MEDEGTLLFEYAKSEIASFENILMIDTFHGEPSKLYVGVPSDGLPEDDHRLLGSRRRLQRNDGFVKVTPAGRNGSVIEVEKNIRVRDLTPNDSGNRYDFGQSINATLGAALSLG
jgi:hypothetical protein